jgi:hypothetical protein
MHHDDAGTPAHWMISVYGREHGAPHIHVTGPDFSAVVEINTGAVLTGRAPAAVLIEVRGWLSAHRDTALTQWNTNNPQLAERIHN